MNRRLITTVVVVGGLFAACGGPDVRRADQPAKGPAADATARSVSSGTFVSLSDFHFNPFYDPALFARLMATEASGWARIFESSAVTDIAPARSDSNYNLMSSAIRAAHAAEPAPDFVVYSGDFLAHGFEKNFGEALGKLVPDDGTSPVDCRSGEQPPLQCFIDRTIEFVSLTLRESFAEAPIYPVLGNNDSYCGDYKVNPVGPFVKQAGATWSRWLIDPGNRASFNDTFAKGGHYTVKPPGAGGRIIALNTVLYSTHYENTCATSPYASASQFQWLDEQLEEAEKAGEGVLILAHVPVGTDAYATLHGGSTDSAEGIKGYWKPEHVPGYLAALAPHGGTIRGVLTGHTHMDQFLLVPHADSGMLTYQHITPGVTPLFGNNPAFKVLTYDRNDFALLDYTTYYLPIAGTNAGSPSTWQKEYRFSEAYSVPRLSISTLTELWPRLKGAGAARQSFELYFAAGNAAAPGFSDENRPAYWCAIGTVTASDFVACVNGGG